MPLAKEGYAGRGSEQARQDAVDAVADDNDNDNDNDDDEDEQEFHDAKEEQPTYVPLKIDKRELKQIASVAEQTFDHDMADVEKAVEMLVGSRITEAEAFLKAKFCKTLPHTLGYAVILSVKCLLTVDRYDIDAATDALAIAVEVAQTLRKEQSFVGSLAGYVFGSGRGASKDGTSFTSMTRIQRHAEIMFAESYLIRAMLSLMTDSNTIAFVREGLNIRQSYGIYKSAFKFLKRTWEEGGSEALTENKIDNNFINAVYYGMGMFNLVLSALPSKLIRVFEMVGFGGHREFGIQCLELAAAWPLSDPDRVTAPATHSRSGSGIRKKKAPKQAICLKNTDGSSAVPGQLTFLCDLSLITYHILGSMLQMPGCNIPLTRQMIQQSLDKYPDSFLYMILRSKLNQVEGNPLQAIDNLDKVIATPQGRGWRQLAHVCLLDRGFCLAALGKWKSAAECFETLLNESTWSQCTFAYCRAVCLYSDDPETNKDTVEELMRRVPKLCIKVAGKSIPTEKFMARKARQFIKQGNHLLLPGLEIVFMLYGFEQLPAERCREILDQVDQTLKSLDRLFDEHHKSTSGGKSKTNDGGDSERPYATYYDDVCLARLLKGLALRELSFPSALTLVTDKEFAQLTQTYTLPATNCVAGSEKALKDAQLCVKQFEYIAMQADNIELDHWILPFARCELAQLYVRTGAFEKARREYGAALNGGFADDEVGKQRHKVSMENVLHLKVHNGLAKLKALEMFAGKAATDPDTADTTADQNKDEDSD
eukprot:jgi/Hompol1/672/HPOL_000984-RA